MLNSVFQTSPIIIIVRFTRLAVFSRFLSSTNLDTLMAADADVRNEIESFARSQLERRGDKRSLEDKLKIAAESNHLVKAFQTSEGQRLMRKAELKSAQV